ncbi:MAG TPA: flagellar hook-length control protein FliK, partial [Steroidobacteraceae bacterium]|nr:flagellar hook-length control protein FliK [Steroidobacteraceae bacterium]
AASGVAQNFAASWLGNVADPARAVSPAGAASAAAAGTTDASLGTGDSGTADAAGGNDLFKLLASTLDAASVTAKGAAHAADQSQLPDQQTTSLPAPDGSQNVPFAASHLAAAAHTSSSTGPPQQIALRSPLGTAQWADELGARLTLMTHQGSQSGSLQVSPANLGPIEVRISVHGDQASVWFGAAHADTRAALEQALPRLKDLFASQGLALADTGVFREPPRQQAQTPLPAARASAREDTVTQNVSVVSNAHLGLVDLYA